MKGKLIVIEGCDGSGKTTQVERTVSWLKQINQPTITFREPGATPVGEQIREILLDPDLSPKPLSELFLFCASRAENMVINIVPSLSQGCHVVCDRFHASTLVYQGRVGEIPLETVIQIDQIARQGVDPDLVVILDIEPEEAIKRNLSAGRALSRQDQEDLAYHRQIRDAYLELANQFGWPIIDGQRPPQEVAADIQGLILSML